MEWFSSGFVLPEWFGVPVAHSATIADFSLSFASHTLRSRFISSFLLSFAL